MIILKQSDNIASCRSCGAKNFDCSLTGKPKDVDTLYDLQVATEKGAGVTSVTLCNNCIDLLKNISTNDVKL